MEIKYENSYHKLYTGSKNVIYDVSNVVNEKLQLNKLPYHIDILDSVKQAVEVLNIFEHYEIEKDNGMYYVIIYTDNNNPDGGSELEIVESNDLKVAITLCIYEYIKQFGVVNIKDNYLTSLM